MKRTLEDLSHLNLLPTTGIQINQETPPTWEVITWLTVKFTTINNCRRVWISLNGEDTLLPDHIGEIIYQWITRD